MKYLLFFSLVFASVASWASSDPMKWPDRISVRYEGVMTYGGATANIELLISRTNNVRYVEIKDDQWIHRVLADGQNIYSDLTSADDEPAFQVYRGVPAGYTHMPMLPGDLLFTDTFTFSGSQALDAPVAATGIVWDGGNGRPGKPFALKGEARFIDKDGALVLSRFSGSTGSDVHSTSEQSDHTLVAGVWIPRQITETHTDGRGEARYSWTLKEVLVGEKAIAPPTIEKLLGQQMNVQDNRYEEAMAIRYSADLGPLEKQLAEAKKINDEVKEKEPATNPMPWFIGGGVLIFAGAIVFVMAKKGRI